MGQRPKELTPHESVAQYWGAELRSLRVGRGLSLAELAQELHCDSSYLGKLERAERSVPASLAESCDRVLQAQGTLVRLQGLVESDRELAPRAGGQALGDGAGEAADVANSVGTLAGKATVLAVLDTGAEEIVVPVCGADGRVVFVAVPRRVFLQRVGLAAVGLTAASSAVSAVVPAHGVVVPAFDDVHPVEHFQRLRQELIENGMLFGPRHVIPVVRDQVGLIQQLRSSLRGTDQQELIRVQAQYTEFCGWLHKDVGEHYLAELWMDRALGLSHLAADHDLTVYVLAAKSELAGDMGVAADAVNAGEQALRMAAPRSRLAALAATRAARGYAINGDQVATERAYDCARELLATSEHDPNSLDGQWLTENRITLSQAHSWTLLGDFPRAVEGFQSALTAARSTRRLSRGVYLARAALASAGAREVEQAAVLGLEALAIGTDTRSGRILTELARLDDMLAPWDTVPAVADFRTAMKDTIVQQA